LKTIHEYLEIF